MIHNVVIAGLGKTFLVIFGVQVNAEGQFGGFEGMRARGPGSWNAFSVLPYGESPVGGWENPYYTLFFQFLKYFPLMHESRDSACDNKKWKFIIPCSRTEEYFLLFQMLQVLMEDGGWEGGVLRFSVCLSSETTFDIYVIRFLWVTKHVSGCFQMFLWMMTKMCLFNF